MSSAPNGSRIQSDTIENATNKNSNNKKSEIGSENSEVRFCNRPQDENRSKHRSETIPMKRQELLRWYGWGYVDSVITVDGNNGNLYVTSDRYPHVKNCHVAPALREHMMKQMNVDLYKTTDETSKHIEMPESFPQPVLNKGFLSEIKKLEMTHSIEGEDRYVRGHGHGIDELMTLRSRKQFQRIPDIVIWPTCHDDVVQIVNLANLHNVVIIPFGGGTNVSRALSCNPEEKRMIISLDTSQMNRVLWVDKANLVVCCEAGIIGQDLVRELEKHDLTTGHEPDSNEFSSLGGWVATRASGMKKNLYGNIEDMVVNVRFVTPSGILEKQAMAPRVSLGPDFTQIVLGSEGTLGVVTEVLLKVRPLPTVQEFGSYVFPNYTSGLNFLREVALRRYQPASLRLTDNEHYKMGQMVSENMGYFGPMFEYLKEFYLTKYRGLDLDEMCAAIAVFEGEQDEVNIQKKRILDIAQKHHGFAAGSGNGKRGYLITFVISYIRDLCFAHGVLSESFETSIPWDRVMTTVRNVSHVVSTACKKRGIVFYICTSRISQVYDTGACIYFYFAYNMVGVSDALHKYEEIEALARDEIIACGGSLSHHHGVGKVRQKWFSQAVSPLGVELCQSVKKKLDPNNIFAVGNLWKH